VTVAGAGPVDRLLPGLAIDAPLPPTAGDLDAALDDADLVVVENLCSLPLNPGAGDVLAARLRGRPALMHHHDLPWQRPRFALFPPPPDDRAWAHVTTTELSRRELAKHGIAATTVLNAFDTEATGGDRAAARSAIGVEPDEPLVVQPTRAIARKNIPEGLALAGAVGATFWLLGATEEGFESQLNVILDGATTRVVRGHGTGGPLSMADVYAAVDAVVLPSSWEGFGNPSVESAVYRRPLAIGRYPVARELAAYGFRWFPSDRPGPLRQFLDAPDTGLLEHNLRVADRHFAQRDLPRRLEQVLGTVGCGGP
ncbi:MAG TPA: hypothetical protein VED63_10975, partial [Acidimicrobiales bacterium]|nr:hypothetical protein [Acidimicrobiales bacterium]